MYQKIDGIVVNELNEFVGLMMKFDWSSNEMAFSDWSKTRGEESRMTLSMD